MPASEPRNRERLSALLKRCTTELCAQGYELHEAMRITMCTLAALLCERREIDLATVAGARLFSEPTRAHVDVPCSLDMREACMQMEALSGYEIGALYESLLSSGSARTGRKRSGSFYTPRELTQPVVRAALQRLDAELVTAPAESRADRVFCMRVCDPAMGAGAFLIEVLSALTARAKLPGSAESRTRRAVVERTIYGVDKDPLTVAVAEFAVWWECVDDPPAWELLAQRLRAGDALTDDERFAWPAAFPEIVPLRGFDLIIGNPPWVAYAGRATQPLDRERRLAYARSYRAFRGFPTLHALFVERAARLAPTGTVALVLPSAVSDLSGYASVRRVLTERHVPREPMLEFGQDAFTAVTQPCFALIADPSPEATSSDRQWRLEERSRSGLDAEALVVPPILGAIADRPPLPRELFGELGFQTSRFATTALLQRGPEPVPPFVYPLLEGRDVHEFRVGAPRLFLDSDPARLEQAGCRLRPAEVYRGVAFVVRQTAQMPIAALHSGAPFRNSLLAGFAHPEFPPRLMVGLLNSSLYRAIHVSLRRDARQAAFPQVKIAHLRALPRPPHNDEHWQRIMLLTDEITLLGMNAQRRLDLDKLVFSLFDMNEQDERATLVFLDRKLRRAAREPGTPRAQVSAAPEGQLGD